MRGLFNRYRVFCWRYTRPVGANMKKCDRVENYIRRALDCGYDIVSACHSAESTFDVRVQPKAVSGGFEITIYYCRLGNVTEKASVFACSTDGWYLPSNVVRLPVKRESWLSKLFYNFLEQCV
jgi:hypothetical protein